MLTGPPACVAVHRAADRAVTSTPGATSSHSFSFGHHYDPANTSYGLLLAHNDEVLPPGGGFAAHPHRDLEIVTWVLEGTLVHEDGDGRTELLRPGHVQRTSAGSGIRHSETAPSSEPGPTRFVQAWLRPDALGAAPSYEHADAGAAVGTGALVPVVSGLARHAGTGALRLGTRAAALHVARLAASQSVSLPDAPYLHLAVARGTVDLEGAGALAAGDTVRATGTGGQRLTAGGPAEVLVWEMHAQLG